MARTQHAPLIAATRSNVKQARAYRAIHRPPLGQHITRNPIPLSLPMNYVRETQPARDHARHYSRPSPSRRTQRAPRPPVTTSAPTTEKR